MLLKICDNYLGGAIPFLSSPAVNESRFIPDDKLIEKRINAIAIPILILAGIGLVAIYLNPLALSGYLVFQASIILFYFLIDVVKKVEKARANQLIDKLVIQEIRSAETPSHYAFDKMRGNTLLLNEIETTHLHKVCDRKQCSLLDYITDENLRKLMIDNHATLRPYHLIIDIMNNNTSFLDYVLENRLIATDDFSNVEKIALWTNIQSQEIASLLIRYGFDVNVKDDNDETALDLLKSGRILNQNDCETPSCIGFFPIIYSYKDKDAKIANSIQIIEQLS